MPLIMARNLIKYKKETWNKEIPLIARKTPSDRDVVNSKCVVCFPLNVFIILYINEKKSWKNVLSKHLNLHTDRDQKYFCEQRKHDVYTFIYFLTDNNNLKSEYNVVYYSNLYDVNNKNIIKTLRFRICIKYTIKKTINLCEYLCWWLG